MSLSLTGLLLVVTGAANGAGVAGSPTLDVRVMAQIERDAGEQVEMAVDDGGVLRSGDGLQLRLRSSRDAYVYVIAHGASGSIQLLRPFSGDPTQALLPAGEEEMFPAEGVFLPLDDVIGRETLFVLASPRPLEDLGPLLQRAGEPNSVEGAYAALREAHPGTHRIDIRHIDRAPLIGLEFAGQAKLAPALLPDSAAPTSRAGRGGVVSIPSGEEGYLADPGLERGGWLGEYEEEDVLTSAGSKIPSVDPPAPVVLPARTREGPSSGKDDTRPASLRDRLGRWFAKKRGGDPASQPIEEDAAGDVNAATVPGESTDEANEESHRQARGGDS